MAGFWKKAFSDMKESAKAQHEVDKAEFERVKIESKANFEENRGRKTLERAKAAAKQSWDDAHMTPSARAAKEQEKRDERIAQAKAATAAAQKRIDDARK